jgi:hypothetical protein
MSEFMEGAEGFSDGSTQQCRVIEYLIANRNAALWEKPPILARGVILTDRSLRCGERGTCGRRFDRASNRETQPRILWGKQTGLKPA